jgi:hypothetical protein
LRRRQFALRGRSLAPPPCLICCAAVHARATDKAQSPSPENHLNIDQKPHSEQHRRADPLVVPQSLSGSAPHRTTDFAPGSKSAIFNFCAGRWCR